MTKDSAFIVRALLLAHAALAARWLLFPGILYWVSQSVGATVQLGGWLCGWALMVLIADAAVAACLSAGPSTRLAVAAAAGTTNGVLASLLLYGAPAVGHQLVFLPAGLALAVVTSCCCRGHRPLALYVTWACVESLTGAALGHTFFWVFSQLLADEHGVVEQPWDPVMALLQIGAALNWLSLSLQLAVFAALRARSRADGANAASSLEARSVLLQACSREGDIELCSGQAGIFDGPHVPRKRSRPIRLSLAAGLAAAYAAVLVASTAGYLWFALSNVGTVFTADSPVPPCNSCYCQQRYSNVAVTRDVRYGQAEDVLNGGVKELRMDVYRGNNGPGPNKTAPRPLAPAVLFVHGGGFHEGDKGRTVLAGEAEELAKRGFVAFSLNYRLMGRVGLPQTAAVRDAVEDVRAGVRYVVQHAAELGVDEHRIAVWGSSAGAITAASLSFAEERASSGNDGYNSNITAAVGISGSLWPFAVRDARRKRHAPKPAPWFDVHGTDDIMVPAFLAKMTHVYLDHLGLPPEANQLAVLPSWGHVPWGRSRHCGGGDPCTLLRPHIYAFLAGAMRLEGLACPA